MDRPFKFNFSSLSSTIRSFKHSVFNRVLNSENNCNGEHIYIPLVNLGSSRANFKNSLRELKNELEKITFLVNSNNECADSKPFSNDLSILHQEEESLMQYKTCRKPRRTSLWSDHNSQETNTYIPLIDFGSDVTTSTNSLREVKSRADNISSLFDKDYLDFKPFCEPLPSSCMNTENFVQSETSSTSFDASRPSFDAINGFLPPLHDPNPVRKDDKEWTENEYKCARREIHSNITYFYKRTLIIWCPSDDVQSELIHALLKRSEKMQLVYDRWVHDNIPYSKNKWGGVIAVYPSRMMTKEAAKEIPWKYKFLKTLELSKLIHCLIKSELKYLSEERTRVTVIAKISGVIDGPQQIKAMLMTFGDVMSYEYHHAVKNTVVMFEVAYAWATHALLAKTVLDGLPFGSGFLEVEVKVTEKEKTILEDLSLQLKKFIGPVYFPF